MNNPIFSTAKNIVKTTVATAAMVMVLTSQNEVFAAFDHSVDTENAITTAMFTHNVAALKSLESTSTGYDKAYALYRLAGLSFEQPTEKAAIDYLKEAHEILSGLDGAEVDALNAGVLGMTMGVEPQNAGALSQEVHAALARAKLDSGAKARAELIHGINVFYTPPAYGGGAEKALALFEQSLQSFQSPESTATVSWGEVEAYIWLGQVKQQMGKNDDAKIAYQQALTLQPECGWANYLLNNLDKSK